MVNDLTKYVYRNPEGLTVVCWRDKALDDGEGGTTVAGIVTCTVVGPITFFFRCPFAAILRTNISGILIVFEKTSRFLQTRPSATYFIIKQITFLGSVIKLKGTSEETRRHINGS